LKLSGAPYLDLINAFSAARTVEDIHAVCVRICRDYGYDYFNYGARLPTSFTDPAYVFVSGYPAQWWERYKEKDYLHADPLIAHCSRRIVPVTWRAPQIKAAMRDRQVRRMMSEAHECGLHDGVSLPVHAYGGESAMLTFSTRLEPPRSTALINATLPVLHLLAAHMHEAVRRIAFENQAGLARVDLTERERECLLFTADGRTAADIAGILRCSERTVVFHLENAREKLGVLTRAQAVARAISWGLILPDG
jgi:DNA-binding CsgD family transcriptional regulator